MVNHSHDDRRHPKEPIPENGPPNALREIANRIKKLTYRELQDLSERFLREVGADTSDCSTSMAAVLLNVADGIESDAQTGRKSP
jgi:histone H3/H4